MPPDKPNTSFMGDDTKDLAARLQNVEAQLAAARAALPVSLIPVHAAGPESIVAETWSQAEQELAWNEANGWPGHPSTSSGPPGKP